MLFEKNHIKKTEEYDSKREWRFRGGAGFETEELFLSSKESLIQKLYSETRLSRLVIQTCVLRGINTAEVIQKFLHPSLSQLTDPFLIKDMDLAVEKISYHRECSEKILIFGDYDVDGTCGAALLSWVFQDLKIEHEVRQPDRFLEGYGLSVQAVQEAYSKNIRTILCVDCGVSSFDAIELANELKMEVIVVDHHQVHPEKGLPKAFAVVNPQREDCESGLKELCGCGLAFYLSIALRSIGKKNNWFKSKEEIPNLKQHLDLVVLATSADMVPLIKDNRILTRIGLQVLQESKKPGLLALMRHSGLMKKSIGPGQLGFTLAPRINASGRLGSASNALKLLVSKNSEESEKLASELERVNAERMSIQNAIWDEVRAQVEDGIQKGMFQNAVVVGAPHWHEGVVGIVASRVCETFQRPAIVLSQREDFAKGSVRSYGKKDVLAALQKCEEYLLGFGGHKMAAGLSLQNENIEAFSVAFDKAVSELEINAEKIPLWVDGSLKDEDMKLVTLKELELLGPFGPGNPEPVYLWSAHVQNRQILKGRHLKLKLKSLDKKNSTLIDGLWFGAAERELNLEKTDPCGNMPLKIAGVPEVNRFQGNVTVQFRVKEADFL